MIIKLNKHPAKLYIFTLVFLTSLSAQAGEVTSTFAAGDTLTATKMTEIKDAVNDNNAKVVNNISNIGVNSADISTNTTNIGINTGLIGTNTADISTNTGDIGTNTTNIGINSADITAQDTRITDLEGASPAIGRIALTVSDGTPTKLLADGVSSFARSTVFPTPSDYVTGTITLKALVSGCDGSNVSVSISKGGVNTGSNSLLFILPVFQTVSIPTSAAFTFSVAEVTMTISSFSDLNTVSLNRDGAGVSDTCTSSLNVQGFIVEYPRG